MLKTPASLSAALLTGQGGHVEEHLERGPGLEALAAVADGRQVDLRLLVVLAADHGHDLAGPGVDAGQRPVDPGAALLAVLAGPAGALRRRSELVLHGVLGLGLPVRLQGGVDPQAALANGLGALLAA